MHYYALVDSLASLPQSQDRHGELLTAHGETQQLIQAVFTKQRKILQLIKDSRKNEKRQRRARIDQDTDLDDDGES